MYLSIVKKFAAFFLVSLYMLSFSEIHQFLKLPELVQHFIQHRQQEPGTTLLSFLELHYVHQYIVDDDYQQDRQLPFRDGDCIANNTITVDCPSQAVEVPANRPVVQKEFHLFNEDNPSLISITDIFQPPRHC